jgi:hypothetical protein
MLTEHCPDWPVGGLWSWTKTLLADEPQQPNIRIPLMGAETYGGRATESSGFTCHFELSLLPGDLKGFVEHPEIALRPIGSTLLSTLEKLHRRKGGQGVCWNLTMPAWEMSDGPSLGLPAAVGFHLLARGKAYDDRCAMTGEVEITGDNYLKDRVVRVGGIQGKAGAAINKEIKKIGVPKGYDAEKLRRTYEGRAKVELISTVEEGIEFVSESRKDLDGFLNAAKYGDGFDIKNFDEHKHSTNDLNSYFTGRAVALRDIGQWLKVPGPRVLVLTGQPGVGKTSLIARTVGLADFFYRRALILRGAVTQTELDTIPEDAIDVAINAHGKNIDNLVNTIVAKLGLAATKAEDLIQELKARNKRTVIVVDALNQANDPNKISSDLLEQIAEAPNIQLLLGTLRDTSPNQLRPLQRFGSTNVTTIDLSDPKYQDQATQDIEQYVKARLLRRTEATKPTPYRGNNDLVENVARVVAKKSNGVFLIASIECETLLARDALVDINEPGWEALFANDIAAAYTRYFDLYDKPHAELKDQLTKPKILNLLRPLAYAEGQGLPDNVWWSLANAMIEIKDGDAKAYTLEQVHTLLGKVGAFIASTSEHNRPVFRPFHQTLSGYLRGGDTDEEYRLTRDRQMQERIMQRLIDLTPNL